MITLIYWSLWPRERVVPEVDPVDAGHGVKERGHEKVTCRAVLFILRTKQMQIGATFHHEHIWAMPNMEAMGKQQLKYERHPR